MLKAIALGVVIGIGLGGVAMAQNIRPPMVMEPTGVLLVKNDRDDDGPGRKLGHYKHKNKHKNKHNADNDDRDGRSWARTPQRSYTTPRDYYAPSPYDRAPPGYGTSYPSRSYDYYRGY